MRYLLTILFATLMSLSSCTFIAGIFQKEPVMEGQVIEVDSLTFTPEQIRDKQPITIAKGITVTPLGKNKAILSQPAKKGKVKYKNVGNDYSKVKDTGNSIDKSTVKDKSKSKEKVKADVLGDGNTVTQSKGIPAWLIVVGMIGILLFIFWPFLKRFLPLP